MGDRKNRVGESNINNNGQLMTIIRYRMNRDMDVQFEDGTIVEKVWYIHFVEGSIKNPMFPAIFGKGYMGVGKYKPTINGKSTLAYSTMQGFLERCYGEKRLKNRPSYVGCSVCDEWLNYQNYAKWDEENRIIPEFKCLDKDILVKNNKIYSPETCVFVDNRINSLLVKPALNKKQLPVGVYFGNGKYGSRCSDGKKQLHLGFFDTPEEAFIAYKSKKEEIIHSVADSYKEKYGDLLDDRLYVTLKNYEVDQF